MKINENENLKIGGNVVTNLEKAKTYDMVSLTYLCFVLSKLGFYVIRICLIYMYIFKN